MGRLWLIYDGETQLGAPAATIQVGCGRQEHRITVFVDGSDTINHYTLLNGAPQWITVSRVRNSVTVVLPDNTGPAMRFGAVRFDHNMDSSKSVTLTFAQEAQEYTIAVSGNGEPADEIQFDTLLNQDDRDSESETVSVACGGGVEDYTIRSVLEFERALPSDNYRMVPYDGGLKVTKTSPTELLVTNYGKISLSDDMYYEIVLAHRNNPRSVARIRVTYAQEPASSGFSLDD